MVPGIIGLVRQEDIWDAGAAERYDAPGEGMFASEVLDPTARHLTPGGRFVIELWVPELRKLPPGQQAIVFNSEPGYIALDTYDVLHQHVVSHHFRFGDGKQARLFRSPHRYIWPSELDLMAQLAGLELEARYADWAGSEFTAESPSHVSVYRLR